MHNNIDDFCTTVKPVQSSHPWEMERLLKTSFNIKSSHTELVQHGRSITLLARKSKDYHLVTRESHQDNNKDVIESFHCPCLRFQTLTCLHLFKIKTKLQVLNYCWLLKTEVETIKEPSLGCPKVTTTT